VGSEDPRSIWFAESAGNGAKWYPKGGRECASYEESNKRVNIERISYE
jgi:hypothetical protein